MSDDLREKCERATLTVLHKRARELTTSAGTKAVTIAITDAILSIAVPVIREECARVAAEEAQRLYARRAGVFVNSQAEALVYCAAAIRALGEKQG